MSHEIDPATGLPRLPENHRWKVTDKHRFVERDSDWGGTYLADGVVLERFLPAFTRETWEEPIVNKTRRTWYGGTVEYAERERTLVTKNYPDSWVAMKALELKKVTPESIRIAADKIMDSVDADEARLALMGTYPPKRLS